MKILSIGNSFSQDAHKWLNALCADEGYDVTAVNLFIGGCSLEQHYNNLLSGEAAYQCELNGNPVKNISLTESVHSQDWDIITLQQASHFSGRPQSYFPYIKSLASYIREQCPSAKILIHQTWAYEIDSDHNAFSDYGSSQLEMFRRLSDAYNLASSCIDAQIIPVGEVIQFLRDNTEKFNYKAGGLSLNRDGFHLSLDYGRYAAAACWYKIITKGSFNSKKFMPSDDVKQCDPNLLEVIRNAVDTIVG